QVVYVTDSGGDRILKVDFVANATTPVNTDTRARLTSLAVRDTGAGFVDILATDAGDNAGVGAGVFFYANAAGDGVLVTGQIQVPDGLSLDSGKNAFLVNGGPGNGSDSVRQVWTIQYTGCTGAGCVGGYPFAGAQLIDKAVPGQRLSDTRAVATTK